MLPESLDEGTNGAELDCCVKDKANADCFTFKAPADDTVFTPDSCISFARSRSRLDCDGVRQQVNSQTSFIDGSAVYGTNTMASQILRQYMDGKLKMNSQMLPVDYEDSSCVLNGPLDTTNNYCGRAGDIRVNEQPGLAALHTLFVREHNRIARELDRLNPSLGDEIIFQEARRIVAAEIQLVTYKEFLPVVLGPEAMTTYGLNIGHGFTETYKTTVDATIRNAFAAAILRFGHTLIHRNVGKLGRTYNGRTKNNLEDTFFNPSMYHSNGNFGPDDILRWIASTRSAKSDKQLEDSVRNRLFKDSKGGKLDLAALNIQRGRDHGLPSYNDFREKCNLPRATNFEAATGGLVHHSAECAKKLADAYECVDDIDLFTGALTEERAPNSLLGPLQQCIMGEQFRALKDGDRFYFERPDPSIRFTLPQLHSIQRASLASIYCANTNSTYIQRNMFMFDLNAAGDAFTVIRCCDIPQVDLNLWADIT